MAYTALELINKSFYLSGQTSRGLEVVTGEQQSEGLDLFNALLAMKAADSKFVPYFSYYTFETVALQESYFVPNILEMDTITFNLDVVRYPVQQQSRKDYFGTGRVDNVSSLPFNCRFERCKGGANILFYFLPDNTYQIKLYGKFWLSNVTLQTDLSTTLDDFYIEYLRYELADYICAEYNIQLQPQQAAMLQRYRKIVCEVSPPDMTLRKRSMLSSGNGLNWGYINFPGWTNAS